MMPLAVVWLRRDLRLEDNVALQCAFKSGFPVLPVFIFDTHILEELPANDARVSFLYQSLRKLDSQLKERGSSLLVKQGKPFAIWKELIGTYSIRVVYVNKDYEPYALGRDSEIEKLLFTYGIPLHRTKDQVIFEAGEILKKDGDPYTVFTPYKRKWLEKFSMIPKPTQQAQSPDHFYTCSHPFPSLSQLGFQASEINVRPFDLTRVDQYEALRNYPAADATTYLSTHLRFGTVSIRKIVSSLEPANQSFLGELIWREFFMQVLYYYPQVVHNNFRPKYNGIAWRNRENEFLNWCEGNTGYPIVDAGMRQLNQTGFMHNRVRMVAASFSCKHLLIDWRWGESYFAQKLLDYELSSNNGNWQWAAGTGCDSAPYFRVFNPHEQLRKFDASLEYIKKWVPEYGSSAYPPPMVEHNFGRKRALEVYREGISNYLREL